MVLALSIPVAMSSERLNERLGNRRGESGTGDDDSWVGAIASFPFLLSSSLHRYQFHPPEEAKKVKTAMAAASAKQERKESLKEQH
jgi:hypothetical protein